MLDSQYDEPNQDGDDEASAYRPLHNSQSRSTKLPPSASSLNSEDPSAKRLIVKGDRTKVWLCFIFPALGGMLFGYIIGVTSGALGPHDTTGNPNPLLDIQFNMATWQKSLYTSINLLGAFFGSLAMFKFGDPLGRRREIILGSCFYFLGSLITIITPLPQDLANSYYLLLFGQITYGFGIGVTMHAAPVYIAEIAPADIRGLLVSLKEGFIVIGMLLGYLMGFGFENYTDGWRYMEGLPMIIAAFIIVGMYGLPESPRWMVLQNHEQSAVKSTLQKIRRGVPEQDIDEEVEAIYATLSNIIVPTWSELMEHCRRALIIGCGLVFFQQVTGQPSVLYYAVSIFNSAGFNTSATIASVGLGFTKLIATGFAVAKVDQYGRRLMLLIGVGGMIIALFFIGLAFSYEYKKANGDVMLPTAWGYVTVGSLMMFVTCYQISFGPISWLMISEIFPNRYRSRAMSLATLVNFGTNFIVALTFLYLSEWLGDNGGYWTYGAIGVCAWVFIYKLVPETKNKTLEEIEDMLQSGRTS
jgi:sugar porter (SP) family MFS transporter